VVARDPYRYFRVEARELVDGLGRAALELEKGIDGNEQIVHMLRLAHTLKGAARVVRERSIAEGAHAIEDLLAPHRGQSGAGLPPGVIDPLLRMLDEISARVASLEPSSLAAAAPAPTAASPSASSSSAPSPSVPAPEPVTRAAPEPLRNVRIEIEEMDALLQGISESAVRLAEVRRAGDELAHARALAVSLVDRLPVASRARSAAEELRAVIARIERGVEAGLDRVDRELEQVRDRAHDLRLIPASTVFPALERAARDAAHELGRSVVFEASGGETRLEANVLFALRDALHHAVSNAVAHGIEPEAERRRLGKAPAGRIELLVERRGNNIAFVCRDDGRGIDAESVRRVAVARGVTTGPAAAAMNQEQVLRLVLESGVTTTERITEVSGRGVGLDVLRSTVAGLKGEVKLTSHAGRGTTVDLCVPLSVSSVAALVLDADGMTVSVPLDCVERSFRLASGDIARFAEHDSVVVDGVVLPFLALSGVLRGTPVRERADRSWSAVVIRSGPRAAAIGADRLVGTSKIVLRPLPSAAGHVPIAAGVSLDAAGDPRLFLDPQGLVEAAHANRAGVGEVATGEARAPILVVDDSLTTRMLEQSILESAGYSVDLATSAEEGFVRARESPHSLFLVDVEMPGMDGFEFVARTRADPVLGAVPAILVSSRDAPEDRRRGAQAGARAYIVKGEFDQELFLRTIRQLIG
jgi:two-component system chemotaxis sensor kinase CheA